MEKSLLWRSLSYGFLSIGYQIIGQGPRINPVATRASYPSAQISNRTSHLHKSDHDRESIKS